MSVVVAVNVVVRCPICEGKGGECPMCEGEGHQNVNMPIEQFARLFETVEPLAVAGQPEGDDNG